MILFAVLILMIACTNIINSKLKINSIRSVGLAIYTLRIMSFAMLFLLLGYAAANYRIQSNMFPILQHKYSKTQISGNIFKIEARQKDHRLYLKQLKIKNLPSTDTPIMIRINTKDKQRNELKVGMRIKVNAELMPPPSPTHCDGFDLARHSYFNQIGGMGYTVGRIYIVKNNIDAGILNTISQTINATRNIISTKIKHSMNHRYHGIASAMLVGETNEIYEDDANYLRQSGTAHLIAISGMHVVSVAGIVFFLTKFIFKRTRLIASLDISKIAAGISILFIIIYLLLAGAPISAQRAVAMSTIFFIGMILNRDYDALNSISIVACGIMLYKPELIYSPGLQMSFAASGALIASFRYLNQYLPTDDDTNKIRSSIIYVINLIAASAAASIATAPFIAYHFHQISFYSILANLISVPVMEMFVMPMGMLSLFLMPLQLEALGLWLMKYGILVIVEVSKVVSEIPHSSFHVGKMHNIEISLITLFLFLAIFVNNKVIKIASLCFFIMIFVYANTKETHTPCIILSGNHKLFAVRNDLMCNTDFTKERYLIPSSRQAERYSLSTWRQFFGHMRFSSHPVSHFESSECNTKRCMICFSNGMRGIIDMRSDISLTLFNQENHTILQISKGDLQEFGTHTIYDIIAQGENNNDNVKFRIRRVRDKFNQHSPWHKRFFMQ